MICFFQTSEYVTSQRKKECYVRLADRENSQNGPLWNKERFASGVRMALNTYRGLELKP